MPPTHPSISDFGFRISETPREMARVRRRCLTSRHDVVLNVMAACLASSRKGRWECEALAEPEKEAIGTLVRARPPLRGHDDVVKCLVQMLDAFDIGGSAKIAQMLGRAGLKIGRETVRRYWRTPAAAGAHRLLQCEAPRAPGQVRQPHRTVLLHCHHRAFLTHPQQATGDSPLAAAVGCAPRDAYRARPRLLLDPPFPSGPRRRHAGRGLSRRAAGRTERHPAVSGEHHSSDRKAIASVRGRVTRPRAPPPGARADPRGHVETSVTKKPPARAGSAPTGSALPQQQPRSACSRLTSENLWQRRCRETKTRPGRRGLVASPPRQFQLGQRRIGDSRLSARNLRALNVIGRR